jgi:hypothetical protein
VKAQSDHRPLAEEESAGTFPFPPAGLDPGLETGPLDLKDLALGDDFEGGRGGGNGHPAAGVPKDVGEVEVGGIVGTGGLDVEAVALAGAVDDGDVQPFRGRHEIVCGILLGAEQHLGAFRSRCTIFPTRHIIANKWRI